MSRRARTTRVGLQPLPVGDEEIEAVAETIRSGWLTTGPKAALLEERWPSTWRPSTPSPLPPGPPHAPRAAGPRSGRRGRHDAVHVAGDGERDRALRRQAWRSSTCAPTTSISTSRCPRRGDRADEGRPARAPRGSALRPRPPPRTRSAAGGGRSHALGSRLPRPEDRVDLGGDLLQSLRHEERRRGGGRPRDDRRGQGGAGRGADPGDAPHPARDGSLYDQVAPGFRRTSATSSRRSRLALVQLDKLDRHAAMRARQFELYDEGLAARRDQPARARGARRARASPLHRPRRPRAGGRHA